MEIARNAANSDRFVSKLKMIKKKPELNNLMRQYLSIYFLPVRKWRDKCILNYTLLFVPGRLIWLHVFAIRGDLCFWLNN